MVFKSLFVVLLVAQTLLTVTGNVDYACIFEKCLMELKQCGVDHASGCLEGSFCMVACKGDIPCIYKCQASYWDEALANLVDCTLSRNKCIIPPDPEPTKCKKPSVDTLAKNFDLSLLTGLFYNVFGRNKNYDCFDNDVKAITKVDNRTLLVTASYDLVKPDGTPRRFEDRLELRATGSPAVLNLTTITPGMRDVDEWRVLAATKSYVIFYYCGVSCAMRYEGVQVLSRSVTLSKADLASVTAEITKRGWKLSEFCRPHQTALKL